MKLSNIFIPTFIILFATVASMSQNTSLFGEWKLSGYNFVNKRAFPVEQMQVTLVVEPSMRISGRGGCNSYGGAIALNGATRMNIGPLTSTDMACDEPSNSFEGLFLQTLQDAKKYSITARELTLTDPRTNSFIRFKRSGGGQTASTQKFLYIDNNKVRCPNAPTRRCLRFKENRSDEWQILEPAITGFSFRAGRFYKIAVRETPVEISNAGESPFTYRLVRVVKAAKKEGQLYN